MCLPKNLENYQNLASAIIQGACIDFMLGKYSKEAFHSFCTSQWFGVLIGGLGDKPIDGEWLYRQVLAEKESGEYGQDGRARKRNAECV